MAYANKSYTWTTGTTEFAIPFEFLKHSHFYVQVDVSGGGTFVVLTQVTDYTIDGDDNGIVLLLNLSLWQNGTTIVNVYRSTPIDDANRIVDFQAGSVLTEEDLDNSALQVYYAAQESADVSAESMQLNPSDSAWDADDKKIINVTNPTLAQDAATKNYVDTNKIDKDGTVAMDASLNMDTQKIINVTNPTLAQDAATKNYVDTEDAKALNRTDPDDPATHWDATSEKITNVAEPAASTDAATKNYVDDTTIQVDSGEWDAESNKIKNVTTPTADNQAATKGYVDAEDAKSLNRTDPDVSSTHWDATGEKITNVADPAADQDAATKHWVNDAITGTGSLPGVDVSDNDKSLFVESGAWALQTGAEARTILDVQTGAEATTTFDARYALEANNLSDLDSASTARTNLGLGTQEPCILKTAALVDTGTGATNVPLNSNLTAGDVVLGIPVAEWTWLSGLLTESASVTISTTHRRDVMSLSSYNGMASYITMGDPTAGPGYEGVNVAPGIYRLQAAMIFKESDGNDSSLTVKLASSSALSGVVNIYGPHNFWSYSQYEGNLTVVIDEIVDVTVASSFALYCWNTDASGAGTLGVDGFTGSIKATCTRICDT